MTLDLGDEEIPLDKLYRINCLCGCHIYIPKSRFPDGVVKWKCSCGNYGTQKFRKEDSR